MVKASQSQLIQVCRELEGYLTTPPRYNSTSKEALGWADDDLLPRVTKLIRICEQYGLLSDAEHLNEIHCRLADGIIDCCGTSGDARNLYWIARDLGRLIHKLPGKLETYLTDDLCKEVEISAATLNKYAEIAKVRKTRRGERDRRYTSDDRLKILRTVADKAPTDTASKAREILSQIESKSKARK